MKKRLITETIFILLIIAFSIYLTIFVIGVSFVDNQVYTGTANGTIPANGTFYKQDITEYINCTFALNVTEDFATLSNVSLWIANITNGSRRPLDLTLNQTNASAASFVYENETAVYHAANESLDFNVSANVSILWRINETFLQPGGYVYACQVYLDNSSADKLPIVFNWSTNKSLYRDFFSPNVTTVGPQNSSSLDADATNWSNGNDVNFSVIVDDIGGVVVSDPYIANCSLYADFTGAWAINQTITVNPQDNKNSRNFTSVNLATNASGYHWIIRCDDKAGNYDYNFSYAGRILNSSNFTFEYNKTQSYILKVDAEAPSLTISPSSTTTLQQGQSKAISCELTDGQGTGTVTLTVGGTEQTCSEGQSKHKCSATYVAGQTGDYAMKCTGADTVGNGITKEITLKVEGGVTGGAGAGAGAITPTEEPITTTTEGVSIQPFTNQPFDIVVQGTTYPVEVTSVGATTATISTGPSSNSYSIGESREIDLNADGVSDIELTLDDISLGRAVFTIKEIEVKVPEEAGVGEGLPGEEVGITKRPGVILGIIIAIIVILAGLYYFTRKK